MAQAANPAVVLPLNQERRRHQRVNVVLNGRYMLLDRREFDCQTVNMSPGGALLAATTLPHIGDPVVAYKRDSTKRAEKVSLESFMKLWRNFEPPRGALVIDSQALSPEKAAEKILAAIGGDEG